MRAVLVLLVLYLASLATGELQAQSFTMASPDPPENADMQIVNGVEVLRPGEWPATLTFKGLGDRPCTATVIGPQLVLTAAHCVAHDSQGDIAISGRSIRLTCRRHDAAGNSSEYDVATCVSNSEIKLARKGDGYERIAIDANLPQAQSSLLLIGYGCTSHGASDYGALYVGETEVTLAPMATNPRILTEGGAVACSGDSGGAAYQPGSPRRIVGVNSQAAGTQTQLAALTDPVTLKFIIDTETVDPDGKSRKARICGIDATLRNCR